MADQPHLQVDLTDRADIRAKLPEAKLILEVKRQAVDDAQSDYDAFKALVDHLAVLAGEVVKVTRSGRTHASPAQDAVVAIVERERRPIGPGAVANLLRREGFPVKSDNAINAALHNATGNHRLKKAGHGKYVPLDYDLDQELPVSDNGAGERSWE